MENSAAKVDVHDLERPSQIKSIRFAFCQRCETTEDSEQEIK